MASAKPVPVFDGHNDILLKLRGAGGRSATRLFREGSSFHVDLPKARKGGFAGGFFAIFVPSPTDRDLMKTEMEKPGYDLPLPDPVPQEVALPVVMEEAALLIQLEAEGALRICRSVADIRNAMAEGVIAAVMHIEGAEAIDPAFHVLDVLYAAGLRSLGPVWSRPTIWGEGVPFRYPSNGDIGPGLTEDGKRLIRRCDAMGIMIDLSHLNEKGFWNVAEISEKPLIATHSNAHVLCPQARNLTDAQFEAVARSGGIVGLNFATGFLRRDGQMRPEMRLEVMLDHLDHMIGQMGEDHVALGSDFDGAVVADKIGSVAGLPVLIGAMRAHGYAEARIEKIAHGNWLRVLETTWGG